LIEQEVDSRGREKLLLGMRITSNIPLVHLLLLVLVLLLLLRLMIGGMRGERCGVYSYT